MAAASHRLEVRTIAVDECRVMDSAQAPLWVEAVNHDPLGKVILPPPRQSVALTAVLLLWGVAAGENIPVIFKAGDDLRQDLMTLELMRTMDDVSLTLARECVCAGVPLTRTAPPPPLPPPPRPPLHRAAVATRWIGPAPVALWLHWYWERGWHDRGGEAKHHACQHPEGIATHKAWVVPRQQCHG